MALKHDDDRRPGGRLLLFPRQGRGHGALRWGPAGCAIGRWPVQYAARDRATGREASVGDSLGMFNGRDRRHVAVVVTSDGRRVTMPMDSGLDDASFIGILRSLLGLDGLLGLITGSRRENGGTRRDGR